MQFRWTSILSKLETSLKPQGLRNNLLKHIDTLDLPPNTLDYLIDELGGVGAVAEMTGRKMRTVSGKHGMQYENRSDTCEAAQVR